MQVEGWTLEEAYTHIRRRRGCVSPFVGNKRLIAEWEREKFGESSMEEWLQQHPILSFAVPSGHADGRFNCPGQCTDRVVLPKFPLFASDDDAIDQSDARGQRRAQDQGQFA